MKFNCLISFSLLLLICACSSNSSKRSFVKLPNLNGIWKGNLQLSDEKTLPFNFSIENDSIHFYNDKEKISTIIRTDSAKKYTVKMPVFNSAFSFQKVGEKLEGFWINYSKSDQYKITFSAVQSEDLSNRFHPSNYYENKNLDGSWEVTFGPNSVNEFKAIGLFNQSPEMLSGTLMSFIFPLVKSLTPVKALSASLTPPFPISAITLKPVLGTTKNKSPPISTALPSKFLVSFTPFLTESFPPFF